MLPQVKERNRIASLNQRIRAMQFEYTFTKTQEIKQFSARFTFNNCGSQSNEGSF